MTLHRRSAWLLIFFILQIVQVGFKTYAASCPVDIVGLRPASQVAGMRSRHFRSGAEVKECIELSVPPFIRCRRVLLN